MDAKGCTVLSKNSHLHFRQSTDTLVQNDLHSQHSSHTTHLYSWIFLLIQFRLSTSLYGKEAVPQMVTEPTTLQLQAQFLNHYATFLPQNLACIPQLGHICGIYYMLTLAHKKDTSVAEISLFNLDR